MSHTLPHPLPHTAIDQFDADDWKRITAAEQEDPHPVADSVLALLFSLAGVVEGFPVDQLTHALQAATRAEIDGADREVVVATLCHDMGKAISDANHAAISAEILRPYVSDETYHAVLRHQDFQLRHYAAHFGSDPDGREKHRGQPWFALAERMVDDWDRPSFDPDYDTRPLSHFEPLVRAVFTRT